MGDAIGLREVAFDTETTGLSAANGDRLIEVACVELVDGFPTGATFHEYVDPQRDSHPEALKVHGLTREFLTGKPLFRDLAPRLLEFFGDAQLVAHNATFDIGFVNAELARVGLPALSNRAVDTVALAKQRLGAGAKVSLDDLCRKFGIDLSGREKHGALVDTQLLARVYLELQGGRMRSLDFSTRTVADTASRAPVAGVRPSRGLGGASAEELLRHAAFMASINNNLWLPVPVG